MTKLVVIETPELKAVGTEKSQQIAKTFEPMVEMLQGFESKFNEIVELSKDDIDENLCNRAKRLRLDIGKVRIDTGKLKDKKKEYIKLEDKAIMGVHNIIVWAVKEKEDSLKGIENHFVNLENERLDKVKLDRENWLLKSTDIDIETISIDLRNMDKDVWAAYAQSKKQERADRIQAEEEAEKARVEAEKDRIAEDERIRAENEKLRLEAIEREKVAEKERKRQAKKLKDQQKKAKAEADRIQREADKQAEIFRLENEKQAKIEREKALIEQAERARESQIQQDKLHAEAKERQKIQAELDAKNEAERVELLRIENEKEALKKAGDKGAMAAIRKSIAGVIDEINSAKFKSKASKQTMKSVEELLNEAWTKL